MKLLSYSNKGSRESNQDLLLECKLKNGSYLFLIVDGMGGLEHGEMAARLVCENIETYLSTVDHVSPFQIQMAINKSNLIIRQRSEALRVSMGATLGGVAVQGEEVIYFWVGDVKIIHFRDSRIIFESKSHNLVNELIDSGNIGTVAQLERYRHVVTRSIHGKTKSGLAEIHSNLFNPNRDILFVCSDGFHDVLSGIQIESQLESHESLTDFAVNINEVAGNYCLDNGSFGIVTSGSFCYPISSLKQYS